MVKAALVAVAIANNWGRSKGKKARGGSFPEACC